VLPVVANAGLWCRCCCRAAPSAAATQQAQQAGPASICCQPTVVQMQGCGVPCHLLVLQLQLSPDGIMEDLKHPSEGMERHKPTSPHHLPAHACLKICHRS
jgi:hypothetical protein